MIDRGFDGPITYAFMLRPVWDTKVVESDVEGTTSYLANNLKYLTGGDIDLEAATGLVLDQNFIKRDPLAYQIRSDPTVTLLGLDYLQADHPNYENEKWFFERMEAVMGTHNALMVPMDQIFPITPYGFGLHTSMTEPVLTKCVEENYPQIISDCYRFAKSFDLVYRREEATRLNLSKQQLRVLECICSGLTNRVTAQTLEIKEATFSFHLKELCRKLDVTTTRELPMTAVRLGLIVP